MFSTFRLTSLAAAAAIVLAACGGSSPADTSTNVEPVATATTQVVVDDTTTDDVASDDSAEPAGDVVAGGGSLLLDFTAFVPGAVQPSGFATDADYAQAALVTDFEKVVIVDVATQSPTADFEVGRNELPRQGATEAIAFIDADTVAVLYPDARTIGFFDTRGNPLRELTISGADSVNGAMTYYDGSLMMVARDADGLRLHTVDPTTGDEAAGPALSADPGDIEGLGTDGADLVVAVTPDRIVHKIDPATGAIETIGTVDEVDDPSGVDVLVNEGELQIAVTDDSDAFNAEESPLRLFIEPGAGE